MTASFSTTASFPRLSVLSCEAKDDDTFGPAGHHFRWFVPHRHGYPAGGFDVSRVTTTNWRRAVTGLSERADLVGATGWSSSINASERDRHHPVHPDAVLITRADAVWKPTMSGLRVVDTGGGANVLIHFNQPVINVMIEMRFVGRPQGTISVRHGAAELDTVPLADKLTIERPGITDLIVPNSIDLLSSLSFVTETAAAEHAERHGEFMTHRDLPITATAAYKLADAEIGIRNRLFVGDESDLTGRYAPGPMKQLVAHLGSTVGRADHVVETPGGPDLSPAVVTVLDHIELAALDPNVARMLGCYWVDTTPKDGLYVVRANYDDPTKKIGLGFAFTRHAADLPKLPEKVTARQLPGIEFTGRRPRGRVGLDWVTPPRSWGDAQHTVMVDVERRDQSGRSRSASKLTEKRPHLVTRTAGSDRRVATVSRRRPEVRFTDRGLEVKRVYTYEVTPIDVFGRGGPPVVTDPVDVIDLGHPVAPKLVRAVIDQHGSPWLDPGARKEATDRTATIDATCEFGEAQHTVAPDAATIEWCWRTSPDDRDPAAWTVLETAKISAPRSQNVTWSPGERVTAYPIAVARAVVVDADRLSGDLERLDPVTRAAVDAIDVPPPLVEVLLDVALLEPGVFAGHQVRVGTSDVTVFGSTAGLAAGDDDTDGLRLTARLFLPATAETEAIDGGAILVVRHPDAANWEAGGGDPPPLIHVPLAAEPVARGLAEGGEVAIDFSYKLDSLSADEPIWTPLDHDASGRRTATIVGRVIADHAPGGARSVLIRVRPDDAARLLRIERDGAKVTMAARHHRPYVMRRQTLGLDGAAGSIQLDFAPDQRFASVWIAAAALDDGGKRSTQVANPAELRVVRPPPAARPGSPYPAAVGESATRGELSPPDALGNAVVSVAWPAIGVGTLSDHVRYEVARALDDTIVATDRERWFRGAPLGAAALGVVPGPSIATSVRSGFRRLDNGTVSVVVDPPSSPTEAEALRALTSGRVRIGTDAPGHTHRLVRVVSSGRPRQGRLEVQFRPVTEVTASSFGTVAIGTECVVDATPDYSNVLADDDLMRQLADRRGPDDGLDDSNDRAFGLVTGMPVSGQRFVDRLAGRGRSRFFYKVRAVFPGETRSQWSSCSVAFHQIDATAANPAVDVAVTRRADGSSLVTFRLPNDPLVTGAAVLTRHADGTVLTRQEFTVDDSAGSTLSPARLAARGGLLDLRTIVAESDIDRHNAALASRSDSTLALFAADVDRASVSDEVNLMPTGSIGRAIALGRAHDGAPLALRVTHADGSATWIDALPGRYEIEMSNEAEEVRRELIVVKYVTIRGIDEAFHSAPVSLPVSRSPVVDEPAHDGPGPGDGDGDDGGG